MVMATAAPLQVSAHVTRPVSLGSGWADWARHVLQLISAITVRCLAQLAAASSAVTAAPATTVLAPCAFQNPPIRTSPCVVAHASNLTRNAYHKIRVQLDSGGHHASNCAPVLLQATPHIHAPLRASVTKIADSVCATMAGVGPTANWRAQRTPRVLSTFLVREMVNANQLESASADLVFSVRPVSLSVKGVPNHRAITTATVNSMGYALASVGSLVFRAPAPAQVDQPTRAVGTVNATLWASANVTETIRLGFGEERCATRVSRALPVKAVLTSAPRKVRLDSTSSVFATPATEVPDVT